MSPGRRLKKIREFANEAEERTFWESNDSSEYIDWSKAKIGNFPRLKPSTETISLRMPEDVLNSIRDHARRMDVPYQSLIKLWCAEKVGAITRAQAATPRSRKRPRSAA